MSSGWDVVSLTQLPRGLHTHDTLNELQEKTQSYTTDPNTVYSKAADIVPSKKTPTTF